MDLNIAPCSTGESSRHVTGLPCRLGFGRRKHSQLPASIRAIHVPRRHRPPRDVPPNHVCQVATQRAADRSLERRLIPRRSAGLDTPSNGLRHGHLLLRGVLVVARLLQRLPPTRILGVWTVVTRQAGLELTPALCRALRRTVAALTDELSYVGLAVRSKRSPNQRGE